MAELTVESGPLRGQTLNFSQDDSFVIGSDPACSLQLQSPGIAGQHLVIKALKNGGFGVKMLGGPFILNGKEVEAARLREGDLVEVADTRLRFGPKPKAAAKKDLGTLGGYRMIEVLGKGGSGTVYRAEQMSLHRNVALKVLPKETTKNPEFVGRFVAEARAAARLSHPNVVQVFDVGHDGDTYFLSMEIMEHGSLEDRLKRDGKIGWEDCLQLMVDAAEGLAYAESIRIVHRDIKPDNLMVDSHDTAKIADLGLAMSDDDEAGKIVGTPHFMSPEQATGKPLDNRSDLYSLGCSFFRLVTGRTLFVRSKTKEILRAHLKDEPESANEVDSEVPAGVAAVIDRLVEKDPDDRYQSARDLIEDLQRLQNPPTKKGLLIGALAVLLIGASAVIYQLATKEPTVITETNGDPAKTAELEKRLRETSAETERLRIERNNSKLGPMQLAARFDAFATKPDHQGTKAASTAIDNAKTLREQETARVAAAAARASAVKDAKDKIDQAVRRQITAGNYRAAVTAMAPEGIARDLLADPAITTLITTLGESLRSSADTQLTQLKQAVVAAETRRDPAAMLPAIVKVEAVVDRTTGWPQQALGDRAAVLAFARDKRQAAKALQANLISSRETDATARFYSTATGKAGVLATLRSFDLPGASSKASELQQGLAEFKIAPTARQFLDAVQAAASYWTEFKAAISTGGLKVSVRIAGSYVEVLAKSLSAKSLQIDHPSQSTITLAELEGDDLRRLFVAAKTSATHNNNRLAFLALHAMATHIEAARVYLSQLDPTKPTSGTGDQRYAGNMLDLNYVVRASRKVDANWRKFLNREVRAAQQLARGLRAFSMLQYTRSQNYLEDLRDRFQNSLVRQVVR